MLLSPEENPLTMDEGTHDTRTLVSLHSEEITTIGDTPLPEAMGIENLSSNSSQCDQAVDASSKLEGTQSPEAQEKSTQGEQNIEDAQEQKTLEKLPEVEFEDARKPEIVENSFEGVFDRLEDILGPSLKEEKDFGGKLNWPLSEEDDDDDDDDDEGFGRGFLGWYPWCRRHYRRLLDERECCNCGSSSCRRRLRRFRRAMNVDTFRMCDCGAPHCENIKPIFMGREPFFMRRSESPYFMKRSKSPEFERKASKDSTPLNQKWNEPEPGQVGAGLANMGNTCFLNAILQCFTHTVPLVQGLQSLNHESISHGEDEFCVLCAVRDQIQLSIAYSGRVISPSNLVNNLNQISSFFRRYQQEDGHEFLQCLLDKLESNWSKYETKAKDSSSSDDNLVKQVFGGRLVSQVHCSKCGHTSDTYEPLVDLSLEIEDVDNLESALKSFTKVESIEDTECGGCKERVQVEKQLMLDQAPSVASFHLKRFKSDGFSIEKIDRKVGYPLELDLLPYARSDMDEKELKYDLYAVVVHIGHSSISGHYFSYIRPDPDKWYLFDDSQVTRVGEEEALSQEAYILLYARKGTAWFSIMIDNWKASSEKKTSSTSPTSVLDDTSDPSTSGQLRLGLDGCEVVAQNRDDAEGSSIVLPFGLSTDDEGETRDRADARDSNEAENRVACMPSSNEPCPCHDDEVKVDDNANSVEGIERITGETSSQSHPEEEGPREASHIQLNDLKMQEIKVASSSMNRKHDAKRKDPVKFMTSKPISIPRGRRQLLMNALYKKRKKPSSFLHARHHPRKRVKMSTKSLLPLS